MTESKINWIGNKGFLGEITVASYAKKPFAYPDTYVLTFYLKVDPDDKFRKLCYGTVEEVKQGAENQLLEWLNFAWLDSEWLKEKE